MLSHVLYIYIYIYRNEESNRLSMNKFAFVIKKKIKKKIFTKILDIPWKSKVKSSID